MMATDRVLEVVVERLMPLVCERYPGARWNQSGKGRMAVSYYTRCPDDQKAAALDDAIDWEDRLE